MDLQIIAQFWRQIPCHVEKTDIHTYHPARENAEIDLQGLDGLLKKASFRLRKGGHAMGKPDNEAGTTRELLWKRELIQQFPVFQILLHRPFKLSYRKSDPVADSKGRIFYLR